MLVNLSVVGRIRSLSLTAVVVLIAALSMSSALPGDLSAADADARQAYSVDVSGDLAVIGASWEDGYSGAAYVLRRNGENWAIEQRLVPSDLGQFDHFGGSVSIDGDRIVIASPWHDLQRGAQYVFRKDGDTWVQDSKIPASDKAVAGKLAANMLLAGGPPQGDVLPADALELIDALEGETGSTPPLMAPVALIPPASVSATDNTMEDRVKITWANTGQQAIAYKVTRDGVLLSLVSSDGSSYEDRTGTPAITYSYCVIVTDMDAEETTPVCDNGSRIIFSPHNVVASEGIYTDQVVITWVDISTINAGYNIYRDDVLIGSAGANEGWFSDTNVDTINVHSYDVAAFVTGGFESARVSHDGWRGVILPPIDVSASDGQYSDHVLIAWQEDTAAVETGYSIYRDGVLIDSTSVDSLSYEDYGIVFGETYKYCVATKVADGFESVRVCDEGGTGLTPPGNVSASDSTFDDKIRVTWDDLSDFEDGYEITRANLDGPPDSLDSYAKNDTRPVVQAAAETVVLGTTGQDVIKFDDYTAIPGVVYTYSVRAITSEGGASTFEHDDGFRSVVVAPFEVAATGGTFEDYVDISWKSISTTTALFKILRDGEFIKTVSGGDRSYRDYGGTAGQEYEYSVIAFTALEAEAVGPVAFGKRELLAPSGLTASDEAYEEKTIISWRDYSRIEQGYLVMRQDTATAVIDTLPVIGPNRSSYTDYTGVPGATYTYSVQAFDSINGELGYSIPSEDLGRRMLLAPTDVNVDTGGSETAAEIAWNDNSGAETGYKIYRDDLELGTTADNATSFVDPNRIFGQNHVYRVCAYDDYGESAGDSASVFSTIMAPVSFNASDVYTDRVEMTWVNQSDIADGYKVYRDGELIQTISQLDLTSYTDIRSMTGSVYPGGALGVAISGNYAYVAALASGLRVVDVSNAANPVQVGICDTPGNANKVVIDGIYAYVADETSLQILDISGPTPTFVGSYPTANALDVAVDGNYVYVANGSAYNMLIINVTDRANPTLAATFNPFNPSTALVVAVSDGYAYLGMSSGAGVRIVDVSNPAAPVERGKIDSWNNYGLSIADGHLYKGGVSGGGLEIWDVQNPLSPTMTGNYPAIGIYRLTVAGDRAYLADYTLGGLVVLDVSDQTNPRLISSYSVSHARDVAVSGGYVYVASTSTGLHIVAPPTLSLGTNYNYCVRAYKGGTLSESACDEGLVPSIYASEVGTSDLYLKLLASDGQENDLFGCSVAISGDRAIIGARDDDDNGTNAGAAYIFERSIAGEWTEKTKLYASNFDAGDVFGTSVAIQGDLAIVGAPGDNSGQGSVYIFERGSGGTWTQTYRYVAEYPDADDNFGYSVAISGDRAIIGSYKYYDDAAEAGAAHVILRGPTGSWSREATLLADDPTASAWFGYSVAISGDRAIVGARKKDTSAGAAYIFEADGSAWTQAAKLDGFREYYYFGSSVAISGDWACVGSPRYCDYGAGGSGAYAGSVDLYQRDAAGTWVEVRKLIASDAVGYDYFGQSVAMMDDRLIVGVNGSDDRGNESGAAYIYRLSEEGTWKEMEKTVAVDGTAGDGLGYSVALDGDYAIIAASNDDDQAAGAGSVYIAGVKDVYSVTATDGTLKSRVSITWDDRSYSETGFRIYRDEDKIIDLAPNTEIYEDFDAEPGRTYEYAVVPLIGAFSEEGFPVSDFGWVRANGNITGSIETINGAPVDSVWIEVTPSHTKALLFDGGGGYVEIPDSAGTFDFNAENSFTVEAWVKYPGDGGVGAGDAAMIAKASPGSGVNQIPFFLGNMRGTSLPGRLRFAISGSLTPASVSTGRFDINDNEWHHVACVHDAALDMIYIYVDGVLEGSESSAGLGEITNDEPLSFGEGPAAGSSFNGQLDEIRIWNVARSDSLIQAVMARPLAEDEPGLVAYWPIGWPSGYRDEASRGVITDLTAGAHYGVFQDGVYWTDNCAEIDIYPITDDLGNYVLNNLYYGTESEFEIRPFADNREFEPEVKRVVLTTDSPVENQVEFTDISTYLVTGTIRYKDTDCAVADISFRVDGEPIGQTDTKGKYSLELERGEHWIKPDMEGHTFEPDSLLVSEKLNGADFYDLTTHMLAGRLGGGCGRSIGNITITISSENACMLRTLEYASIDTAFSVALPPQNYLVSAFVDVDSIPEGLSKTDVVRFFQNLGVRMAEMDSMGVDMDFVYRAPLKVEIAGFAEYLEYLDECPGPLTFGDRILPDDLPVIPQLSEVMCSIQVYEDYGTGGLCPLDSGTVVIYDELFDALNDPVELEVRDGLVVYPTIAIAPSLIVGRTDDLGMDRSFQRSITAVVNVDGRDPVAKTKWALVTGHLAPEGADFVTGTTEIPMYILRDPPGDQSYAFLEEGHSLRTRIEWDNSLHNLQGGANVALWRGFKIGFWKWKISFKATVATEWLAGKEWSDENYTDYTVTTKKTFSTSAGDGAIGAEGDVFIGMGHNFIFSEVGVVEVDFSSCEVEKSVSVGFEPDSVATVYSYTQQYIEETLIPELYSKVEYYESEGDELQSEYFLVKAEYWSGLLQENEDLKSQATTLQNRSFSAGADYTYFKEESTEEAYTRTSTFVIDGSLDVGLEFGSSSGGSVTVKGQWHHENLLSYTDTTGTETETIGYTFSDDDAGDHFTVDIKDDGRYPTPVFDVPAGVSSCPYEPWPDPETGDARMMPRDKPALNIAPIMLAGVPSDEPAVFTLSLANLSPTDERRLYVLRMLNTSNPYGAIVKVGDVPIANGLSYYIETSQAQQATLTVERGPNRYNYEDLAIVLYPPCESGDWEQSGALADTIYFSASFDAPCSDVTMLLPESGWTYDKEDQDSTTGILMLLTDYEFQISETDTLQSVWGQYRRLGVEGEGPTEWFEISADSLGTMETVIKWYPPETLEDGVYELRAYTQCRSGKGYSEVAVGTIERYGPQVFGTPEPADGELSFGEDISITFDKLIECLSVHPDTLLLYPDRLTLSYADWPDSGAVIDFETACDEKTIIISPTVIGNVLEGRRLEARVTSVTDRAGNPMVSPATWAFDYRKSMFTWSRLHLTADVPYRNTGVVTTELVNGTGEPAEFTIAGLPSWIESVSPSSGTIPPSGTQTVIFTLQEDLTMDGVYETEVTATTGDPTQGVAVFDFNVTVSCHEPEWVVEPSDFEHSMTMVAELSIGGALSVNPGDKLAAFVGNQLRGVAELQAVPVALHPYQAFLTIYSNRPAGETVRFQVWEADSCTLYNSTLESCSFVANGSIGSASAPYTLTASETGGSDLLTIAANRGWTWISTNVRSVDMDVTAMLADLNLAPGDLIKSQTEFSQFVEYTDPDSVPKWVPPFEFDNVSAYMVNLAEAGMIRHTGTAVLVDTAFVPVRQGWNWIGYVPTGAVSVKLALGDLEVSSRVVTGDIIKSQNAFAEYLDGDWYGNLTEMEPGKGYKLHLATVFDSVFAYPPGPYESSQPPILAASGVGASESLEAVENAPDWTVNPYAYQFNMTMTAVVRVDGLESADGRDMIGAFVGDECRGLASPEYIGGLRRYEAFLMIHSNEASGEKVEFRVFDADAGVVCVVTEQIDWQADAVVGTVTQPFVLSAVSGEEEDGGVPKAYALGQNVPNPFNPSTTIYYDVPAGGGNVSLRIYDVSGRLVRVLVDGHQAEGSRSVTWDGTGDRGTSVASGVYFYRMSAPGFDETKKMVLLR